MKTNGMEYFIHPGQEPHAFKGKIWGLNNWNQIFYSGDDNPRAYVYAHRFVPLLLDSQNSERDTCTTLWITKDNEFPRVNVISAYWDGATYDLPEVLTKSVETNIDKNNEILIGMDSNAHSVAFGGPNTDRRGTIED